MFRSKTEELHPLPPVVVSTVVCVLIVELDGAVCVVVGNVLAMLTDDPVLASGEPVMLVLGITVTVVTIWGVVGSPTTA